MKIIFRIIIILVLLNFFFTGANSQTVNAEMNEAELQKFVKNAGEKTEEYSEIFKNLSAEETKTIEVSDKNGNLEKRKTILSDLIIFVPETKSSEVKEFHNVREVDGKVIKNKDERAQKLFERLEKTDSIEKELDKIQKESLRFDKEISFYGFTLNQGFPLASNLVSSFKFEESGREIIDGNEVSVIKYQQISDNPAINFKITAPDYLEISKTFWRGTLWIDAKNQRLWRKSDEMTVESPKFVEPIVLLRQEYFYQPSNFNINLPSKIIFEHYHFVADKSAKLLLKNSKIDVKTRLAKRLTLEYKNFRKFDVNVKSN